MPVIYDSHNRLNTESSTEYNAWVKYNIAFDTTDLFCKQVLLVEKENERRVLEPIVSHNLLEQRYAFHLEQRNTSVWHEQQRPSPRKYLWQVPGLLCVTSVYSRPRHASMWMADTSRSAIALSLAIFYFCYFDARLSIDQNANDWPWKVYPPCICFLLAENINGEGLFQMSANKNLPCNRLSILTKRNHKLNRIPCTVQEGSVPLHT